MVNCDVVERSGAANRRELPSEEARIRQRRMQEHGANRSGIEFALRMLERYTGTIHRNLSIDVTGSPALTYLKEFSAFAFEAELFNCDSDCQCGTVSASISAAGG